MVAAAIVEVVRLRQACPSGARRPLIAESAPRACTHTCGQHSRVTMLSQRPPVLQGRGCPLS